MKKSFLLYLVLATSLLFNSGCTKLSVEEQASAGIWFNQRSSQILIIDKEQSAFIVQSVDWVHEKDKEPTFVYRDGTSSVCHYRIENNRFIFTGYWVIYGYEGESYGYEEAWIDADGNLIVQVGRYLMSNDQDIPSFRKDTRSNSTWEVVYSLKDPSFLIDTMDIR